MKIILLFLLLTTACFAENLPQIDFEKLTFGEEQTLEIMTWNIQKFPKTEYTVAYSADIISSIDADIICLQEIQSKVDFDKLLTRLGTEKWDGFLSDSDEWQMNLAYLYKKNKFDNLKIYEIFTDDEYAFPRSPLVMKMNYKEEQFVIINNHLKAMPGEKNENRRIAACQKLYEYSEENFASDNVCIIGDLNDELVDETNVFEIFLRDENYLFADILIAEDSKADWSYPYWKYRSHLDHILISNELFDEFSAVDNNIKVVTIDKFMDGGNDMRYKYITDR